MTAKLTARTARSNQTAMAVILLILMTAFTALSAEKLTSFESNGKYGYKAPNGQVRIEALYAYAGEFNQYGLASVIEGSKAYLIDQKGRHILEIFIFDNGPDYFQEGLARFLEKGKMGFFDARGRKVIAAKYDFAHPFSGGRAEACNGCKRRDLGEHWTMEGGVWVSLDKQGRAVPSSRKQEPRKP